MRVSFLLLGKRGPGLTCELGRPAVFYFLEHVVVSILLCPLACARGGLWLWFAVRECGGRAAGERGRGCSLQGGRRARYWSSDELADRSWCCCCWSDHPCSSSLTVVRRGGGRGPTRPRGDAPLDLRCPTRTLATRTRCTGSRQGLRSDRFNLRLAAPGPPESLLVLLLPWSSCRRQTGSRTRSIRSQSSSTS